MSAPETAWERGRLDARAGPKQLLFGRMYEDVAIELRAFGPGGRVFCIASAGCTAAELARRHDVVAVDINPVQVAYAARRLRGEPATRGRAERAMGLARFFGPAVGWWPRRLRTFLDMEHPDEQVAYWHRHLAGLRFRAAFDALLSLPALGKMYSSRLLASIPTRFGAVLRGRLERGFARHPNRDNPYAKALLLGQLDGAPPPPEARRVRIVHADAAAFLEGSAPASFDGFSLSNILDGADESYARRLFAAVRRAAAPGAVAVLRSFADADPSPENRAAEDRAMLWGSVLVRPAIALT